MIVAVQLQLLPDAKSAILLRATLERFNAAASWLASIAFQKKITNKFVLHKLCYFELRQRFELPADTAIRCLAQTIEAYKRDRNKQPQFRKHAAVPFSMGKNVSFKGHDRVSISTLQGRVIVPFVMGCHQRRQFDWPKGQSDLVLRKDGKWFLLVTVEDPEAKPATITEFIGVDMGVVNIAVDSDGVVHSSRAVEAKRILCFSQRRALSMKTNNANRAKRRSYHRAITRLGVKEGRYRKDVNHRIAKILVAKAKDTGRGIAIEDLKGIRDRTQFRKRQRAKIGGWAFSQLRQFVEYKSRLAGVSVVLVDARNTSRTCSQCNHCEKANRKNQENFECRACGHKSLADFNAARNIRARAIVNAPHESERHVSA